jgi:hypothetical protein
MSDWLIHFVLANRMSALSATTPFSRDLEVWLSDCIYQPRKSELCRFAEHVCEIPNFGELPDVLHRRVRHIATI